MSQFPLPLAWRSADGEADFYISEANGDAVARLDAWPDWPNRTLVLTGGAGSGKSHLARIFSRRIGPGVRLIDDADRPSRDEAAMFNAWNDAQVGGPGLLLAARAAPASWDIRLPDLASRLRAAPIAAIAPPDDALLGELVWKLFRDRGLNVQPAIISYMIPRIERSFAAAASAVATVDAAAMAARRGVTVPLVRVALGLGEVEDNGTDG